MVSLPYLMTGYDQKSVSITANKDVNITLKVDFDLTGFNHYRTFAAAGFSAHWIRAVSDQDWKATVWFTYK
jgi:hypothetical protein